MHLCVIGARNDLIDFHLAARAHRESSTSYAIRIYIY